MSDNRMHPKPFIDWIDNVVPSSVDAGAVMLTLVQLRYRVSKGDPLTVAVLEEILRGAE